MPTPTVAASLANECLKSVPLGKESALELVDSLSPYLEWQSDLAYKKDPPKDYFYPGFDVIGELAKVKADLEGDKYKGEYEFQLDLQKRVFAPGQDGHYAYFSDILVRALRYRRQVSLVSVSEDGSSLPVIKLYDDVKADAGKARAVAKINGQDAAEYVEELGNSASGYQDVDTTYNSMFYSKAVAAAGGKGNFMSGGRSGFFYHGANTTVEFADGTTKAYENQATVTDFSGVTDGASFYKKFCTPRDLPKDQTEDGGNFQVPGYPKPVIATKDGVVSGYYLTGDGLEDVAVLTLTSFEPNHANEFQAVVADFLREASEAGKTKLVLDLQNNGGGLILLGYDLFRQLFPTVEQDGNSRWKETDTFLDMARVASKLGETFDPSNSTDYNKVDFWDSWFNFRSDVNLTNQNFATFDDKFAPHVFKDTKYTALIRWNLSDPLLTTDTHIGIGLDVSGYGARRNLTQYFKPENIVMLYDGACSSTCTLASEMLRIQGGVQSIAMGGRPKEGAIQAVGGVKGSQVLQFNSIHYYANYASSITDDDAIKSSLSRFKDLPYRRATAAGVNVRDQILRGNVNDGVPAQFVKEDADCRLYWTAPMINDVSEVWKSAANAAFNGAKCAHGAISGSSNARRAVPAKVAPRAERLSANIDINSPLERTEIWNAVHLQRMIDLIA